VLAVEDLACAYGDIQVVWGVSFEVRPGEIVTLVGGNGAGKTTTLCALSGLLPCLAGRVRFLGEDIAGLPPHAVVARGISHVPEGRHIWPRLTVLETLELGAYHAGARAERAGRLDRVYALFPRLAERRRQLAGTMSGGEQQMLAIGRALMAGPRLLMLDEPSLGLAPRVVEELFQLVVAINDEGVTVLLVEQNVQQALAIADRAYVLESGRVAAEGDAGALLHDERVRAAYLGA
jgi:branched-chain amino acid transport system ATP-binding protein